MQNGIVAINKPEGISSARAVARVKKSLAAQKVGHTGTLDPFATGLLLCAVNKATRISSFFLESHKRYVARICLGKETDTCDRTGKTVFTAFENDINALKNKDIKEAVNSFIGIQNQIPPFFSALKHKGQPLYKLARQGKKIQKPPRQIEIFDIIIKNIELPFLDIDVFCSSGTYIRSLGYDLGKKLGCGAHVSKLCRTGSGSFGLEQAVHLDVFETLDTISAEQSIIPMADCLEFLPKIVADEPMAEKIRFGQKLLKEEIRAVSADPDHPIRVIDNNNTLLAIIYLNKNMQEYNYSCVFAS